MKTSKQTDRGSSPAPEKSGKVTANEIEILKRIRDDQYHDGADPVDHEVWSWSPCGDHSSAATLGSLIKKGLAGGSGEGEDATCWITQKGMDAIK